MKDHVDKPDTRGAFTDRLRNSRCARPSSFPTPCLTLHSARRGGRDVHVFTCARNVVRRGATCTLENKTIRDSAMVQKCTSLARRAFFLLLSFLGFFPPTFPSRLSLIPFSLVLLLLFFMLTLLYLLRMSHICMGTRSFFLLFTVWSRSDDISGHDSTRKYNDHVRVACIVGLSVGLHLSE